MHFFYLYKYKEKYNDEIESCTKIPQKFCDFLDISESAKIKYDSYNNRLKLIDIILCLTSISAIMVGFADVIFLILIFNHRITK